MSNVEKIDTGVDRADSWALIQEIEKVIDKIIDNEKITPVEILGALDFVSKSYFDRSMSQYVEDEGIF